MIKNILLVIVVIVIGMMIWNSLQDEVEAGKEVMQSGSNEFTSGNKMRIRQSQAQDLLHNIYQKQHSFFAKNGYYTSNADSLQGFDRAKLKGNKYYKLIITDASEHYFIVRATGNIDGDDFLDEWEIDQDGKIEHLYDDIENY